MRVLVFRAAEAAAKTAQAIKTAGHEAILAPATTIVATGAPRPSGKFDAVLATSANAFELPAENLFDDLRGLPVFAVGTATREAARRRGFRDVRVSDSDAAALVSLVRLTLPAPARLLYLAGRHRKSSAEQSLGAAGYAVFAVEAYTAEATECWPDAVLESLRTGGVDAALHFSRRSADLALALAGLHDVLESLVGLAHLCLSDDVAAPLRQVGARDIRVAARPDEAAMLNLLSSGRS